MATKKSKKPPRSREYAGPNTVGGVKAYLKTNALQKAKTKAIEGLPKEQQIEVIEWAWQQERQHLLDALKIVRDKYERIRAAKERGFKPPQN